MRTWTTLLLAFWAVLPLSAVELGEAVSVTATGTCWAENRIWAAYRCEDADGHTTLHISRTPDMARTWEDTFQDDRFSHITLWATPDGTVLAFCSAGDGVYQMRWTPTGWTVADRIGEGSCAHPPVVAGDGSWLLGVTTAPSEASILRSTDKGAHWTAGAASVTVPDLLPGNPQPCLLPRDGGAVSVFLRSNGMAWSYEARSEDGGTHWSVPQKFLPMPDLAFSLTRLLSGHLLLLKNGRLDQGLYVLPEGLYAYLSDDEGETWYGGLLIDTRTFSEQPQVTVSAGGRIIVLFSNNFRASAQVCMALTTEKEIDAASGSFTTAARIMQPVLAAEQGPVAYRQRLAVLNAPKERWAKPSLRVATYNIQYPAPNIPSWDRRLATLKAIFKACDFDIVGAQEPYKPQLDDLMEALDGQYAYVSVNRHLDPEHLQSHYNPIIYKKSRVELLDWGTFWYSAAPALRSWGSSSARFCTWAKFKDRKSGFIFFHFNSHFDYVGMEIRIWSAYLLVEKAAGITGGYPAFFTGDFNSDETTRCYRELVTSGFIADSMRAVDNPVNEEYHSITNYKPADAVKKDHRHIDHIFYTPANSRPVHWELVTDSFGGDPGSDHLPIYIDWKIAN